ncbi:MAG: hypothetical protein QM760_13330 [Nibricoccus sp.]
MDQVSMVIQQQIASGQFMVDEDMAEAMGVELPGAQVKIDALIYHWIIEPLYFSEKTFKNKTRRKTLYRCNDFIYQE